MDVKVLGEKLKALNEKAQSALENHSNDLWHEANVRNPLINQGACETASAT